MKKSAKPLNLQMNLPLVRRSATVLPEGKQEELSLALAELLINAARESAKPEPKGGRHESETDA